LSKSKTLSSSSRLPAERTPSPAASRRTAARPSSRFAAPATCTLSSSTMPPRLRSLSSPSPQLSPLRPSRT
ncbi:hypothetical protein BGZ46_005419, partial [Entomortierella lignicola]